MLATVRAEVHITDSVTRVLTSLCLQHNTDFSATISRVRRRQPWVSKQTNKNINHARNPTHVITYR